MIFQEKKTFFPSIAKWKIFSTCYLRRRPCLQNFGNFNPKISVLKKRSARAKNSLVLISEMLGIYRDEESVERFTKAAETNFVEMVFEEATFMTAIGACAYVVNRKERRSHLI